MNRNRSRVRASGPRYIIVDRKAFARVLREAIDRLYGGNARAAADAVEIPQPTLHRMCSDPSNAVSASSLRALRRLLGPEDIRALGETLLTPEAQSRIVAHRDWIDANRAQRSAVRPQVLKDLSRRLEREVPDVATEWKRLHERQGFQRGRRELALWRVLAPLAEADAAGRIERTHEELTPDEFRRFVRLGWEREKILLRRAPDVVRAQEFSGRDDTRRSAALQAPASDKS